MLTFIDFFAGVGGFRKGMMKAGHKPVGWCEIDKHARKSYIAIHEPGDEWNATDIRLVRPEDLPEADCYCFGFPCQAFSIAGQRRGFEDTRGTLFFEVMPLARERQPKYLFAENVAGLLSHDGGRTFATILCSLWECGYEWQYQVLNSKNFGVPQNRERVYIIGHLRGTPRPEVFPVFGTDGKVDETDCEMRFLNRPEFVNHKDPVMVIQKTHGATTTIHNNETGTLQAARVDKIPCIPVLTAQDRHGIVMLGVLDGTGHEQNRRVYSSSGISPTLNGIGNGGNHEPKIFHEAIIRKLTPRECWRLQGWDDEDFEKAAAVCSDSQLYKQAGNGVTVNVIEAIAKRLGPSSYFKTNSLKRR